MKKIIHWLKVSLKIVFALFVILVIGVIGFYAIPRLHCGLASSAQLQLGSSYRTLKSGGIKRCYLMYVPLSYQAGQPVPVVFSLHGFMGDPYDLRGYARWEKLADANHFLVVYPQGSSFPLRWNVGPGARIDDINDFQFMEDLIVEISSLASVDPGRIFVTGFSNGGEKASQIGCALADRVAAIGVVAGLGPDFPGGCTSKRPLPVIAFFGTAEQYGQPSPTGLSLWLQDLLFNISLEKRLPGPASPADWSHAWAVRNGCQPEPIQGVVSDHVFATRYIGCKDHADVVLYMIQGMGHAWPGGNSIPIPGFGESTTEIDASEAMWAFFQDHPLKE